MKLSLLLSCLLGFAVGCTIPNSVYSLGQDAASSAIRSTVPADNSSKQVRKATCATCPEGIFSHEGDQPLLRWVFSNAETLLVCGYLDSLMNKFKVRASEFDVINCRTGAVLYQAGALEPRILRGRPDVLELTQTVSLPTGSNWAYRDYPLQQWYLKPAADSVALSGPKFIFKRPALTKRWIKHALATCDSLMAKIRKPDNPFDRSYELYLDLLFTCMIAGNKEAERQFFALPGEHVLDGAFSESYHMDEDLWNLIKDQTGGK